MKVVIFSEDKEWGKDTQYLETYSCMFLFFNYVVLAVKMFFKHFYQYEPLTFIYCAMIENWDLLILCSLNLSHKIIPLWSTDVDR